MGDSTMEAGAVGAGVTHELFSDGQWEGLRAALGLSPRELEVVQLIFDGETEARMAWLLGISQHTVHTHVKRIYAKLGVGGQREVLLRVFAEYLNGEGTR